LIDRGADIDAPGKEYYGTPLHAESLNGNIETLNWEQILTLLEHCTAPLYSRQLSVAISILKTVN
jgi:hypothetical protein